MSNNNKHGVVSRREFLLKSSVASVGLILVGPGLWGKSKIFIKGKKPNSKFFGVQIGVITYSFRSMPSSIEQVLQYCVDSNISAIELMGDTAEEYAGKPVNPVKMGPRTPGQ